MERQRWGTRIGLVLAVAGNAIGLGNFLRFPGMAAQNGGGAFMIPYLLALLLLGIPLMWVEWAIGRRGGRFGFSTTPGFFYKLWRHPSAKYLGTLGLVVPMALITFYAYIVSWTLAYAFFSAQGSLFRVASFSDMQGFLSDFQGVREGSHLMTPWTACLFFVITMGLTVWILRHGISRGIERLAKVAMPALLIMAALLVIRVMTLGTPAEGEASVWDGFNFIWQPDWALLGDFKVWLAAAGQIFFTLSVGTAAIGTYASYLRDKDDIALTGLTTVGTNEFAEVVLGGSIAIPISVAFFGITGTQEIAAAAYDLPFVAMPIVFQQIPLGAFFSCIWFLLLFFAGITSMVALCQPAIAFLEDHFRVPRARAAVTIGLFVFLTALPIIFIRGFLDQLDFWTVNIGLALFALSEVILFAWIFGSKRAWKEIHLGADIRIPGFFRHAMTWVTPVVLMALLGAWTWQDLTSNESLILMSGTTRADFWIGWGARGVLAGLLALCVVLVRVGWRRQGLPPADTGEEA